MQAINMALLRSFWGASWCDGGWAVWVLGVLRFQSVSLGRAAALALPHFWALLGGFRRVGGGVGVFGGVGRMLKGRGYDSRVRSPSRLKYLGYSGCQK